MTKFLRSPVIFVGLVFGIPLSSQAADKPNILYIVADDLGYGDLGVHGCKDIPTPNIDALAAQSVEFVNGYVTGAVCSPSRCALMTGRYQQRDGIGDWIRPGSEGGIAAGVPTIADYLGKVGYRTAAIGKWHLGEGEPFIPLNRGFGNFYGFLGGGRSYYSQLGKNAKPSEWLLDGHNRVADEPAYTTFGFGDKAVEMIGATKNPDQPFFIYLCFNAVHAPLNPPQNSTRFDGIADKGRRAYAGMLFAMDESIGKVFKKLRESGQEDNTIVYFLSDNGGPITRNAPNNSKNGVLRGGKGETWEGGVRVPSFLKWNGHLKPGTKFEAPITQMDVTATMLALAGAKMEAKYPIDGVNLLPFLDGTAKGDPHASISWEHLNQWAIREGDWKLTYALPSAKAQTPVLGLYHLKNDIGEQTDLSAQYPERVANLKASWSAWKKDVEGDVPETNTSGEMKKRKKSKTNSPEE